MNYEKLYNQIIDNRKCFPLTKTQYGENHHILPRSLGGTDVDSNMVKLTAREHFLCHYCLLKMQRLDSKNWYKMYFAFNMFRTPGLKYVNSRFYEKLKIEASKNYSKYYSGENSANYGKLKYTNGNKNIFLSNEDVVPNGFNVGSNIQFRWCNDGIDNRRIDISCSIPAGCVLGKLVSKNTHIWITNGDISTRILKESPTPSGYRKGTSTPRTTGYIFINDGVNLTSIPSHQEIPSGFKLGLLKESATKNKIWYTNGVESIMLDTADEIPIGYHKGRIISKKNPYKRYTNGLNNVTVKNGGTAPDGYYLGMTRFK